MEQHQYNIPAKLNITIALIQIVILLSTLIAISFVESWPAIFGLALVYGITMNSAYAMLHEAEHNLLHPNPFINMAGGVILALFFPAPFHLLRQGHIGHHQRNRSDDEAFDFYFEGESPVWKYLQFYGILTGLFWVVIFFSNCIALITPKILSAKSYKKASFDRPTEAFIETLNPRYLRLIRLEALAIMLFHGNVMYWRHIPFVHYVTVLFGFGLMWSALQYVHHYGTKRDVRIGALNLKTFALLDFILLTSQLAPSSSYAPNYTLDTSASHRKTR